MRRRCPVFVAAFAAALVATGGATAVAATAPINLNELRSAHVPSLCGHPAGKLVNGSLPLPANTGVVTIPAVTGAQGSSVIAFGDLNHDGARDAAVVVECDQGGVSWPDSIQLYTHGTKRLGGISLDKISHGDRDYVHSVSIRKDVVTVTWTTNRNTDFGCCSTLDYSAHLHLSGGKLVVTHAARHDEHPTLAAIVTAVHQRSTTAIRKHATAAVAADLIRMDKSHLMGAWHCYGDPVADTAWPKAALSLLAPDPFNTSWTNPGSRYCITTTQRGFYSLLRLTHNGYRSWRADLVVIPAD